jgi:hypothetical protein
MHTGRTIEELIELVQHINMHNGGRPRPTSSSTALERNTFHRNDPSSPERLSSSRSPQSSTAAQPAWLAVFL